ncbi:hypothetical protein N0V91_010607 [Didymella pomorum]|uniref:C3H1-type domain-containing protein n=1 Tax=Didymella pomorum TaxID=749634 RepID=A0A9W9D3D4_9PLEO|nr:hypothetical protein N0V91_010607 [Didymella pomorum]
MASNHVPSDQVPLQGQSIYTDPSSFNFFPNNVERYGTPSWEAQLHQNAALTPNTTTQNWHGTYPQQTFNSHAQTYAGQTQAFRTASPYQYGQFNQHGAAGTFGHTGAIDPSLGLNSLRQQQQSPYPMPVRNATPSNQSGTVTPQALQQLQNARASASPFQVPKSTTEQFTQQPAQQSFKPVRNPVYEIPKGKKSGGLYVLDVTALAKATNSTPLNNLVTLGAEPTALPSNRTALPMYTARQSIKELKKIGADNKKLLAKLASSKSSLSRAIKFSSKNNASSPGSLKRELSDSSDYTDSSEDDSEYSDSDDEEESPLPASRPDDDPHKAVCYDVIKASWFPRRSPLNSEKIKSSMRDLWEVLNTIQKRWRADSKAVAEAEEAKKIGELPTLKSRVTSQRDLLQSALKAALEHAHPDVLYHLGQVKPFLYLCYQFLANRFKAKDFDGPLPSAIYEILAKCGTLTTELVEETKVSKALVSMKKQANDKNKAFIQQIVDAAAAGSKKAKANSPPAAEAAEAKGAKRPASEPAVRTAGEGLKKAKPAEASTVAVKKENAVGVPKPTAAAAIAAAAKRPGEKPIGAPAPVRARVTTTNKSSSIFASLNAATKKPAATATAPMATKSTLQSKNAAVAAKDKKPTAATAKPPAFSFASTMAALTKPKEPEAAPTKTEKDVPNETPEQKAKRLRKEARRHLRVTFRPDASLVAIKYFSHDPEEELGHDENFTRDAGDLGGEGHMFKQHKELEEDDDDEDDETEYRPWKEPSQVDFSVVDPEERKRNYTPYGGGENLPTCPEKEANEQREKDILMVFYTSPADIPPSPHEPPEHTEENTPTVTMFGTPPEKCLNRAPKPVASAPAPSANLDFAGLESLVAQLAAQNKPAAAPVPPPAQPSYAPPAPAAAPNFDLAAIMAQFGSQPPPLPAQTSAPAPPQFSALPTLPAGAPPPPPGAPPAELAAFLAAMQAQGGALPPMPPGFPPMAFPGAPFAFPSQPDASAYQQQQQQQPQDPYYQQDYQQDYQQPNGGTKRPRDDGNNNNSQGGQGKKHKAGGKPHKVQPCKFFQKGTCNKGENCTYIHDLNM